MLVVVVLFSISRMVVEKSAIYRVVVVFGEVVSFFSFVWCTPRNTRKVCSHVTKVCFRDFAVSGSDQPIFIHRYRGLFR